MAKTKKTKHATLRCAVIALAVALVGTGGTYSYLEHRKAAAVELAKEQERYCNGIKGLVNGLRSEVMTNEYGLKGCQIQLKLYDAQGAFFHMPFDESLAETYYVVFSAIMAKRITDLRMAREK